MNKTSLEAKIISPDLSRVAVLVLRHQVWSNDSGDGGFVGGVQNVGEDGAKIIDFTAADHTESLALKKLRGQVEGQKAMRFRMDVMSWSCCRLVVGKKIYYS